jgi:arginase
MVRPTRPGSNAGRSSGWDWPAWHWKRSGATQRGPPVGRSGSLLALRSDRYAIHLDVDVVDFTDAPLSEHPSRNTGLKLDEMLRALRVLASGPGLVAITLAELNPHNAAADDGLLERFAASLADAIG